MNPTAIITGDIHLREDIPVCRVDDFISEQTRKIKWLDSLQKKYDCPILDAGDLFSKSKPSHFLTQWAIRNLPYNFHTIPGNHDLPSHNISLLNKSALGVLIAAGAATVSKKPFTLHDKTIVYPFPWGKELSPVSEKNTIRQIALCHVMTYTGERPWPNCRDPHAKQLLRKMKGYNLVITGHNHKSFVVESRDRILVNPGSLMRTNVDQINFKPRVYLWYAQENQVTPVYVPIKKEVISREHIDTKKNKDERINAFVEKLVDDLDISSSFTKNMEEYFATHKTDLLVQQIVWKALDTK